MANTELYSITSRLMADTGNYDKAMAKSAKVSDSFRTSVQGISHGLTVVDGPLSGVTSRFDAARGIVTGGAVAVTAFGAAVAGASMMLSSALDTFEEYELANLRAEQMVKATGYAAGLTAEQLQTNASEVALATMASVTGIQEAQDVLLTFKSVQGDTFLEAISLSQDMAAVFGGEAKDKAMQLGKALEDPVQGINALKRSGVSFTAKQRNMITSLVETGQKAKAQQIVLKALKEQVGGAGSATAGGLAGAIDTLGQRWDEFKLALVTSVSANAVVSTLMNTLSNGLNTISNYLSPDDESRLNELFERRAELVEEISNVNLNEDLDGLFGWSGGMESELFKVENEIKEIEGRIAEAVEKEDEAKKKAAAKRQQDEQERLAQQKADRAAAAAEELAKAQEQGKAKADNMDMQYATEEQKINMHLERQLASIDNMQLTENELARRGFETLEEIRRDYREKAYAQAQKEHHDLRKLREDEEKRKQAALKAEQQLALSTVTSSASQITAALDAAGKKRSGIYKALFLAQQASAIPSMIVDTEKGATAALALGPIAGPPASAFVRAAGYASIGVVAGQTIAGIAHGGLGYVPSEATYLLQKGEGVLSPKQNVEVQAAAERINAGGISAPPIINIIEDADNAGRVETEQGPDGEQMINVWIASYRTGGPVRDVLDNSYQRIG